MCHAADTILSIDGNIIYHVPVMALWPTFKQFPPPLKKKLYVLPTEVICAFWMNLGPHRDYFPVQCLPLGENVEVLFYPMLPHFRKTYYYYYYYHHHHHHHHHSSYSVLLLLLPLFFFLPFLSSFFFFSSFSSSSSSSSSLSSSSFLFRSSTSSPSSPSFSSSPYSPPHPSSSPPFNHHHHHHHLLLLLLLLLKDPPVIAPLSFWCEQHVHEDECVALVEWYRQGETEIKVKPVTVPLFPPTRDLAWTGPRSNPSLRGAKQSTAR